MRGLFLVQNEFLRDKQEPVYDVFAADPDVEDHHCACTELHRNKFEALSAADILLTDFSSLNRSSSPYLCRKPIAVAASKSYYGI